MIARVTLITAACAALAPAHVAARNLDVGRALPSNALDSPFSDHSPIDNSPTITLNDGNYLKGVSSQDDFVLTGSRSSGSGSGENAHATGDTISTAKSETSTQLLVTESGALTPAGDVAVGLSACAALVVSVVIARRRSRVGYMSIGAAKAAEEQQLENNYNSLAVSIV